MALAVGVPAVAKAADSAVIANNSDDRELVDKKHTEARMGDISIEVDDGNSNDEDQEFPEKIVPGYAMTGTNCKICNKQFVNR